MEVESEDREVDSQSNVDPSSGLVHDPLNGGANDQTGSESRRRYCTYIHPKDGKKYTIDRAPLTIRVPEPHKLWSITPRGGWFSYRSADKLNWEVARDIDAANRWRYQSFTRAGVPASRTDVRPDYTPEQRSWLFDFVKRHAGEGPGIHFEELTRRFNERFSQTRAITGIQTLYSRLKHEYKAHGGRMVEHKGRKRSRGDDGDDPGKGSGKKKRRDDGGGENGGKRDGEDEHGGGEEE